MINLPRSDIIIAYVELLTSQIIGDTYFELLLAVF